MYSEETTNLKLRKWSSDDYYSNTDLKFNWDVLDAALGALSSLPTEEKTSIILSIKEIYDSLKSVNDGSSGSDFLGMTPISEIGSANTPQSIIETLINKLVSIVDNSSGADFIGCTPVYGLNGSKVQQVIESLNEYIKTHIEGNALKHNASSINNDSAISGSSVKDAIEFINKRVNSITSMGNDHDPLVTSSLVDVENEDFGTSGLNGRLEKWENRSKKIESSIDINNIANIISYGAAPDGVTDVSSIFNAALTQKKIIYLPIGRYKMNVTISGDDVVVYGIKPKWNKNTSAFNDGSVVVGNINITGSNVEIRDLGIANSNGNGIFVNGNPEKIKIKNCNFNVQNHNVLIEQNGGTLNTVDVIDCESYGGIHGFIAKAKNVKFINCKAYNASTIGFGAISDNMNGATKKSICSDVKFINCHSEGCSVDYAMYSRDYTSENNSAGIAHDNVSIINCSLIDATGYGILAGDDLPAPSGMTYNEVTNINIIGCTEKGCVNGSIHFGACNTVMYTGNNFENALTKSTYSKNVFPGINNFKVGGGQGAYPVVITQNSTTPSVANGDNFFETNNTSTTQIVNFTGAKPGQIIIVRIKDDYTSVIKNSYMNISKNIRGKGSIVVIRMKDDLSCWEEICSKSLSTLFQPAYASDLVVDWSKGDTVILYFTGNVNSITFANAIPNGNILNVMMWGDVARSITTWASNIKFITKPTATNATKKIMMQFFYDGTNYSEFNHQLCDF